MQDITNRLQSLLANFLSSEVIASPESGTVNDTVSLQLSPGQRVQAQVEATLTNGSFKVSIANQSLQVLLPRNTQPGDVLDLIFVSNQPRPTFLLAESSVRPQENVSNAGRFISSLLPQATKSSSPLIIESATQILSRPPENVPELAGRLQQAVTQSGLFYESHQAQWLSGSHPLSQLLTEPQAQLSSRNSVPDPGLRQPELAPTNTPSQLNKSVAGSTQIPENNNSLGNATRAANSDPISATKSGDNPVHPNSLTLVQNQLHALETQQFAWRGEVWPGQWLDWEIAEREYRVDNPEEDDTWQSRLNLSLPKLGDVSATLQLSAMGLRLTLQAKDAATLASFQASWPALQKSLEASNIPVVSLTVNPHAETRF